MKHSNEAIQPANHANERELEEKSMIVNRGMNLFPAAQSASKYFLPYQRRWLDDEGPLEQSC